MRNDRVVILDHEIMFCSLNISIYEFLIISKEVWAVSQYLGRLVKVSQTFVKQPPLSSKVEVDKNSQSFYKGIL